MEDHIIPQPVGVSTNVVRVRRDAWGCGMTPAELAHHYLDRGIAPVPIPFKSKNPNRPGWERERYSHDTIDAAFGASRLNIGVMLGVGGIVDVDIDEPELVGFCDELLPPTGCIYGRKSKRRSHRLYRIKGEVPKTKQWKAADGATVIELRGTGGQSLLPGSTHDETGERYEFDEDGEPAEVAYADLLVAVEGVVAVYREVRGEAARGATPHARQTPHAGHEDLTRVARAYVAAVGNAAKGGRNRAAFGLAGHLAAFRTEAGETLAEGEILGLVRGWNAGNSPPMDDAELKTTVHSALTNGEPRAPKIVKVRKGATGDGGRGASTKATIFTRSAVVVSMADVAAKDVDFLWYPRIPTGAISVLAGEPGGGKSYCAMDLAARVSTGAPWPDSPGVRRKPGSVLMLLAEDGLADTIRPRLDACGADCSRIFAVQGVKREDAQTGEITDAAVDLSRDINMLDRELAARPDTSLVVIDTINSYIGGKLNSDKDNEVRQVLLPLRTLAEARNVAILAISHTNKLGGGNVKAINRVMGSMAFVGVARAAWLLTQDETDGDRKLLTCIKSNLAKKPHGLAFRIGDTRAIEYESEALEMYADDALGQQNQQGSRVNDAISWLEEYLSDQPRHANDCIEAYKAEGLTFYGITEAKKKLGVKCGKARGSFHGPSYWALPRHIDASGKIQTPDN